jgi:hypothetical protein
MQPRHPPSGEAVPGCTIEAGAEQPVPAALFAVRGNGSPLYPLFISTLDRIYGPKSKGMRSRIVGMFPLAIKFHFIGRMHYV